MLTPSQQCFNNYMGFWLLEPLWMSQTVAGIKGGLYPDQVVGARTVNVFMGNEKPSAALGAPSEEKREEKPYAVIEGVAILPVTGVLMKAESKFVESTSTVALRQKLRAASKDDEVAEVLLLIESPGGHVAGTMELAEEVARTNAIKPVTAQINDLGASAAYWVASQASTIYANRAAEVGSIGVVAVVYDTSGKYEKEGVKVHVISTGPMKGAGTPGTEITDEILDSIQAKVDGYNKMFKGGIASNRTGLDVDAVATGETWLAEDALGLGLIDAVSDSEITLENMVNGIQMRSRKRKAFAKLDQLAPSREK